MSSSDDDHGSKSGEALKVLGGIALVFLAIVGLISLIGSYNLKPGTYQYDGETVRYSRNGNASGSAASNGSHSGFPSTWEVRR